MEDPDITSIPADHTSFIDLVTSRSYYKTRAQRDAEAVAMSNGKVKIHSPENKERFNTRGVELGSVIIFPSGLELPDQAPAIIESLIQDLEDWILGGLLGKISKGRQQIIRQYEPILIADPDVSSYPANTDDLIQMIMERADYKTLPEQIKERAEARADDKRE